MLCGDYYLDELVGFLRGVCGEAKPAGFRPSEFPVMARQCGDLARVRPIGYECINP